MVSCRGVYIVITSAKSVGNEVTIAIQSIKNANAPEEEQKKSQTIYICRQLSSPHELQSHFHNEDDKLLGNKLYKKSKQQKKILSCSKYTLI